MLKPDDQSGQNDPIFATGQRGIWGGLRPEGSTDVVNRGPSGLRGTLGLPTATKCLLIKRCARARPVVVHRSFFFFC